MKKINLIFAISTAGILLTMMSGCDTRKDIVPELEKSSSTPPVVQIRRHNSGQAYLTNFTDTALIGSSGYRLDFNVNGNADLNSLDFECVTGCSNVTYTQIKKDSGLVLVFVNNGKSAEFTLTVKNKFGQTGKATFTLVTNNQKPLLKIRNYNYTLPFGLTLNDTIKTSVNAIYNLEFQLIDDNSTFSNIVVKRVTLGDNNPYVVGSTKIDFNYSAITAENNYVYKIYVVDALGLASDTCIFKPDAFFNKLPIYDNLQSAVFPSSSSQQSDAYLTKYISGNPPFYCWPSTITIKAHDKDQNYGGYIKKIRWRIRYYRAFNSSTFDETFVSNYSTVNAGFSLTYSNPDYKNGTTWAGLYGRVNLDCTLIDNNNDSTNFTQIVIY
jgi:hypothetical protein